MTVKRKFQWYPYIFISPFFILFLCFSFFPILYSLVLSFYKWNGVRAMEFVGVSNYLFVLFKDYLFWKGLAHTALIVLLSGIPQHVLALAFAFIINMGLVKLRNFFKGVLFMPYITSSVAIAMIFLTILGTRGGLINDLFIALNSLGILKLIGPIHPPFDFIHTSLLTVSISFMIFWKWVGWNTIIYLAGLQAIPQSIYEAARIDGANWGQIFIKITVPMMKPIIFFATSMTLIYGFQCFDEAITLDGIDGALYNGNHALTAVIYVYVWAFKWASFGIATASSYLLCLFIVILSGMYSRIMKRGEV